MRLEREDGAAARLLKCCVRFFVAILLAAQGSPASAGCYQSRCAAPGATITAPPHGPLASRGPPPLRESLATRGSDSLAPPGANAI